MRDEHSSEQIVFVLVNLLNRIRTTELERAWQSLAGGRPVPQVLEQFAHGVAASILHGSMQALNQAGVAQRAEFRSLLRRMNRLYGAGLTNEAPAAFTHIETASRTLADRRLQKGACDDGACMPTASSGSRLDDFRLRRVLDHIAANIGDDITLANLARVAGYSPFHFARKFTLAMGIPPHRYISRMRMDNAMAELAAGELPLAEIALNAHFSSQASFTRAFHRATGMTPKEYRRRRA
jgi:AraC-like DNA-binding protein